MRHFSRPRARFLSSKIAYVTWKRKSDFLNSRTQASLLHLPNNSRLVQDHLRAAPLVPVLVLPQDPLMLEVSRRSRHGHRPLPPAGLHMPILQGQVRQEAF
jgi:hypothetical protein